MPLEPILPGQVSRKAVLQSGAAGRGTSVNGCTPPSAGSGGSACWEARCRGRGRGRGRPPDDSPRAPESAARSRIEPSAGSHSSTVPGRASCQARPRSRRRPGPAAAQGEGQAGQGQPGLGALLVGAACPRQRLPWLTRRPFDCSAAAIVRSRGFAPCTAPSSSTLRGQGEGQRKRRGKGSRWARRPAAALGCCLRLLHLLTLRMCGESCPWRRPGPAGCRRRSVEGKRQMGK